MIGNTTPSRGASPARSPHAADHTASTTTQAEFAVQCTAAMGVLESGATFTKAPSPPPSRPASPHRPLSFVLPQWDDLDSAASDAGSLRTGSDQTDTASIDSLHSSVSSTSLASLSAGSFGAGSEFSAYSSDSEPPARRMSL